MVVSSGAGVTANFTSGFSGLTGGWSGVAVILKADAGQGNQPLGRVIFDLDSGGFPIAELKTGTNS